MFVAVHGNRMVSGWTYTVINVNEVFGQEWMASPCFFSVFFMASVRRSAFVWRCFWGA